MDATYQNETFHLESDHWWYRARQEIILSQIRRRYPTRRDLRILDVGCGAGTMLKSLGEFGQASGLDASPEAAEEAARRSSCEVIVAAIPGDLPSRLGRFDVVCLFDVLEHLEDDVEALRCLRGLLENGGTLFVTVPAQPWIFGIHDEINEHRRRYSRRSLNAALSSAGLAPVRVSYFNLLLSPMLIPAICWRNFRRSGHNFQLRSRMDPVLQRVFEFERHLMQHVRLPFGLSLLAVSQRGEETAPSTSYCPRTRSC